LHPYTADRFDFSFVKEGSRWRISSIEEASG